MALHHPSRRAALTVPRARPAALPGSRVAQDVSAKAPRNSVTFSAIRCASGRSGRRGSACQFWRILITSACLPHAGTMPDTVFNGALHAPGKATP